MDNMPRRGGRGGRSTLNGNQHENTNWNRNRNRSNIGHHNDNIPSLLDLPRLNVTNQNRRAERSTMHRDHNRKFHLGFKKLEEWLKKDSNELVVELMGSKTGFEELLDSNLSGDMIILVINILAKLCSTSFTANKSHIMNLASTDKFIESLQKYVLHLQLQDAKDRSANNYFWKDVESCFTNLHVICASIIESIPTRACEILPKTLKAFIITVDFITDSTDHKLSDDVKQGFKNLEEKLILCKQEIEQKKRQRLSKEFDDHETPPDNFRELNVYPSSQEVLSEKQAFIRKNIINGAYDDVDHYLDVQFRLLKEDFVAPLREGVRQFLSPNIKTNSKMKFSNIRIHQHVEFIQPYFKNEKAGVLLQFQMIKNKPLNINHYRRRFMFGSLLCFTNNNFTTIIFGKIIDSDMKLLQIQQIAVELQPGVHFNFQKPYLMVECTIYFEPYYHVLKALQNIYDDTFPMKKYLINVDPSIESPQYLTDVTNYVIKGHRIQLLDFASWPNAAELKLDDTQYEAFKSALTQCFSVIQGPPGTGKTHLGLEITKALLQNQRALNLHNHTPILVVCYTNHALDQFLEGLIDTTKEIVRVGGQSKNKKLEEFNINLKRRNINQRTISSAFYNVRSDIQSKLNLIECFSSTINALERHDSIISFNVFEQIHPEFSKTWFASAQKKHIIDWLFGGRNIQSRRKAQQEIKLEQLMEELLNENKNTETNIDQQLGQILEDEHRNAVEDVDDLIYMSDFNPAFILNIKDIKMQMAQILNEIRNLDGNFSEISVYNKRWELEADLFQMEGNLNYLQMRLQEGREYSFQNKLKVNPGNFDLKKPHHMLADDRWQLYFYWLGLYKNFVIHQLNTLQIAYRKTHQQYLELKEIEDIRVMKEMLVVGMTTTGAARLQASLQAIKSQIVIVEEAAEVLESHIVVSLTKDCQQLILIGDHKQLRPSTATYKLETNYNLGISMFERMVRNKIQCHVLGVQHRMRPEFAKLIVPSIYPNLRNHKSVESYPPVMGVSTNLYFVTHDNYEQDVCDTSKANMHEAQFLIAFTRYLIQNEYKPEDITIVAAYSGQMFALWRLRSAQELLLKDVRITVLDNYQGEESKIILLSLVRSNPDNIIGFLKNENRVCVALSRAKEGFYMIGNMDILCNNSTIWPKIRDALEEQNALGTSLQLHCQRHQTITKVSTGKDFNKVPEGGCSLICGDELPCGHNCAQICHITDRVHSKFRCKVKCTKILCNRNHMCKKLCYEDCGNCMVMLRQKLPCEHEHSVPCSMELSNYKCLTPVTCTLPCTHKVNNKPCWIKNLSLFKCPFPCDTRVEPCGHACMHNCHMQDDPDHLSYKCFKPCGKNLAGCSTGTHKCPKTCFEECPSCDAPVLKKRSECEHMEKLPCCVGVDEIPCRKPCKKLLPCGHKCLRKCNENCGGCKVLVNKTLPSCKHMVKTVCSKDPDMKYCKGKCPKILACGHPCTKQCNEVCTTECRVLVKHSKRVDCGHTFQIPCFMSDKDYESYDHELLQYCQEPCNSTLECKHNCSGKCGNCAQGRMHTTCMVKCGSHLVCGHECNTPCRQTCQPCTKDCSFRCYHSKCKKKCGDPCTKCKEPCRRKCVHSACRAKCGDRCTIPPCYEPCKKKLKCCHNCVGFCSDPCPHLCRICDRDELCEVFLGSEADEDARFVLLTECNHVIESEGMEQWLQQDSNQIGYKCCPKCKTTLCTTQRYSDYIKVARDDVINVKKRYFGNSRENEIKRMDLLNQLKKLHDDSVYLQFHSKELAQVLANLENSIKPILGDRRQPINMLLIETFKIKIYYIQIIVETFKEAKLKKTNMIEKFIAMIKSLLLRLLPADQRITKQETLDFDMELNRLARLAQLFQVVENAVIKDPKIIDLHNSIKALIFGIHVFDEDCNATSKKKILKLHKYVKSSAPLSEKERKKVIQAMGMASGHWYKCPNGHYYAIGECGGAMQQGKCADCGAAIGGDHHRLLSTNQHASEIDNSAQAAWPPR